MSKKFIFSKSCFKSYVWSGIITPSAKLFPLSINQSISDRVESTVHEPEQNQNHYKLKSQTENIKIKISYLQNPLSKSQSPGGKQEWSLIKTSSR